MILYTHEHLFNLIQLNNILYYNFMHIKKIFINVLFFSPSSDLLRIIMCRDCKKTDYFVVSILKYWAQEFEDKLAEHINQQVSKFNGTPKKRQRFVCLIPPFLFYRYCSQPSTV